MGGSGEESGVDGDNGDGRSSSCVGEDVLSSVGVGSASCRAVGGQGKADGGTL